MKSLLSSSADSPRRSSRQVVRPLLSGLLGVITMLAIGGVTSLQAQTKPVAPAAGTATPAPAAKDNLLAVLKAAGKYTTFLKVVEAAGMTATLEQPGPLTVFAPTDDAFAKMPAGALDHLLKPASKPKLVSVVNYHLAPGKLTLAALGKLEALKTLNGEEIDVDTGTDGKIEMDDSRIIAPDVEASNGMVQGVDAVLQP